MKQNYQAMSLSLFRHALALFTLFFCLRLELGIIPSTAFAQDQTTLNVRDGSSMSNSPATSQPQEIVIPPELGFIEDYHQGTNGKIIIYIQDAHDSLEAQENIANVIWHLVEKQGVRTVFEEGYEGLYPSDEFFSFLKYPQAKKKVSYFLMDKLRLGGAEYAHINRTKDFELVGVDSIRLHKENIDWYKKSASKRIIVKNDLEAIHQEIRLLANQHFHKELKMWMKLKDRLDKNQIHLLDYLKRTVKGSIESYPNIQLLVMAASSEDKKIIDKAKAIDAKELFQEIDRFENDYADAYLITQRDKKIYHLHKSLALLKRFNRIEATPDEFALVKQALATLNTHKVAEFLSEATGERVILSNLWEIHILNALQFYKTAEARDGLLEKALADHPWGKEARMSVLVYGGFHKNRIKGILNKLGFSYFIMTPKITEMSNVHKKYYKHLMSGGYHPFEIPFFVAKAAPTERVAEMMTPRFFPDYLLGSEIASDPLIAPLLVPRAEMRTQDDDYPSANFQEFVDRILQEYDLGTYLEHGKVAGGYKNRGYWVKTTKGEYFLKWNRAYAKQIDEMAALEMAINHFVNQKAEEYGYSWRIPYLHATKSAKAYTRIDGNVMMLYEYVDGDFAWWGESGGIRLKPTMEMMAEVHSILWQYPKEIPGYVRTSVNAYHDLPDKILKFKELRSSLSSVPSGERTNVAVQFLDIANAFIDALEVIAEKFPPEKYERLAKQLVHSDYAPIHLVYDGVTPTRIVDWENANVDTVAVDFAKRVVPFNDLAEFDEFVDAAAHYQNHAREIGHRMNQDTLNALPYIRVLHRVRMASDALNHDLTRDINLDGILRSMRLVIGYATNRFQEFDHFGEQVANRMTVIDQRSRRTIRAKNASSGNILSRLVKGSVFSSNSKESPISVRKYRTIRITSRLERGQSNNVEWKVAKGGSLDIDGYDQFRMKLKINQLIEDREIVNQRAAFKIVFKGNGKDVYAVRTPDIRYGIVEIDIPPNLNAIDTITIVFENAMATIREIDLEIEHMEFLPTRSEMRGGSTKLEKKIELVRTEIEAMGRTFSNVDPYDPANRAVNYEIYLIKQRVKEISLLIDRKRDNKSIAMDLSARSDRLAGELDKLAAAMHDANIKEFQAAEENLQKLAGIFQEAFPQQEYDLTGRSLDKKIRDMRQKVNKAKKIARGMVGGHYAGDQIDSQTGVNRYFVSTKHGFESVGRTIQLVEYLQDQLKGKSTVVKNRLLENHFHLWSVIDEVTSQLASDFQKAPEFLQGADEVLLYLDTLADDLDVFFPARSEIRSVPRFGIIKYHIREAVENLNGQYSIPVDISTWTYGLQELQRQEIEALLKAAEIDDKIELVINDIRSTTTDRKIEEQYQRLQNLPHVRFVQGDGLFNPRGRKVVVVNKEGLPSVWAVRLKREWESRKFFHPIVVDAIEEQPGKVTAAILLLDSGQEAILRQKAMFNQFVTANRANIITQLITTYEYVGRSA